MGVPNSRPTSPQERTVGSESRSSQMSPGSSRNPSQTTPSTSSTTPLPLSTTPTPPIITEGKNNNNNNNNSIGGNSGNSSKISGKTSMEWRNRTKQSFALQVKIDEDIIRHGILGRQGKQNKPMKKWYCVLLGTGVLRCFHPKTGQEIPSAKFFNCISVKLSSADSINSNNTTPISTTTTTTNNSNNKNNNKNSNNKNNNNNNKNQQQNTRFQVITVKRTWEFEAESENDAIEWINAISTFKHNANALPPPPKNPPPPLKSTSTTNFMSKSTPATPLTTNTTDNSNGGSKLSGKKQPLTRTRTDGKDSLVGDNNNNNKEGHDHRYSGVVSTSIWSDVKSVKDLMKRFDAKNKEDFNNNKNNTNNNNTNNNTNKNTHEGNTLSATAYPKITPIDITSNGKHLTKSESNKPPMSPRQRAKSRARRHRTDNDSKSVRFPTIEISSEMADGDDAFAREDGYDLPDTKPRAESAYTRNRVKSARRGYVKGSLLSESRSGSRRTVDWNEPISFISWKETMRTLLDEQNNQKPLPEKDKKMFEELLNDDKKIQTIFLTLTNGNKFMTMQQLVSLISLVRHRRKDIPQMTMTLLSQTGTLPFVNRDHSPLPNSNAMDGGMSGHVATDSILSTGTVIENAISPTPRETPLPSPGIDDDFDLDATMIMLAGEHEKVLGTGHASFKKGHLTGEGIMSGHMGVGSYSQTHAHRMSNASDRSESASRTLTLEMLPTFTSGPANRGSSVTSLLKSMPLKNRNMSEKRATKTKNAGSSGSNRISLQMTSFQQASSMTSAGSVLDDEDDENKTVVMRGDAHTYDTFKEVPLLEMDDNLTSEEFTAFQQIREHSEHEYEYDESRIITPLTTAVKSEETGKSRGTVASESLDKRGDAEENYKYDDFRSRMEQMQASNAITNSAKIRIEIPENAAGELLGNFIASQIGICVPSADVITSKDSNKAYDLLNAYGHNGEEYKNSGNPPTILVFEELDGMSINTLHVSQETIQRERYLIRSVAHKIMGKKFPQKLGRHCKAILRDSGFIFALDVALCNPTRFPVDEPFEGVDTPELLWIGKDEEGDYSLYSIENPLFGPDKLSFINKSGHYTHLERLPAFFKAINTYYKSLNPKNDNTSKSNANLTQAKQTVNNSIKLVAGFLYDNLCSVYEWDQKNSKPDPAHVVSKERIIPEFMRFITEGFLIGLLELSELNIDDLINVTDDIKTLDAHMSGVDFLDIDYMKTFLQICRKFTSEIELFDSKDENDESGSDSESESGAAGQDNGNEDDIYSDSASASMSRSEEELLMMKLQYMFPDEKY